ncbi:MAG: hypothetical protein ACRD12_13250 [Acidimicrobiales bacterium]
MSRRDSLILRITAVWTFFVWGVFVRNVIGDDEHSTGFKVVHLTIAVVSVGLAVSIWRVSTKIARRARERDEVGTRS